MLIASQSTTSSSQEITTEECDNNLIDVSPRWQIFVSWRADHVEEEAQLRSRHSATHALSLHGHYIYERSCLLDIQEVSLAALPA
jgi:hypothetical protein